MEQESIYDWLWLLLVFGAGSRKIWKLLEQYETPQKVRQVLQTETDLPFIHEREQRSIRSITNEQIGKLIQNCAEKRIELVAYDDENYPESLRQIYNPPVVLFYQGQLSVLSDYPALTVEQESPARTASAQRICCVGVWQRVECCWSVALRLDWIRLPIGQPCFPVERQLL